MGTLFQIQDFVFGGVQGSVGVTVFEGAGTESEKLLGAGETLLYCVEGKEENPGSSLA